MAKPGRPIIRYLGIDYGTKRIGLSVSDSEGTIASPLCTLERRPDVAQQARRVIEAGEPYDAAAYVVGLPLNMDGSEGPQAKLTRGFGIHLQKTSGKPVHFWDERLSSMGADDRLAAAELTRGKKKARRDAVAAQIILQSFLDAQSGTQ